MLFFAITALPVEFIYRYRLLCLNEQTSLKRYSCLLLGSIFGASCYGVVCYIGYYVYGAKNAPNGKAELGWLIGYDIDAVGAVVFGTIPNYIVVFFAGVLTFGSYAIVIYCNIKIFTYMERNKHVFSPTVRRANRELNKMLTVQAALPFILYVLPMGFFVIGLLVPNEPSVILSIFSTFSFGWIPVGNAACALFFVSAYRNLLAKFLPCKNNHIHANFLHVPIRDTENYTVHAYQYKNNLSILQK
uniref:Opsin n=1 Tax=Panagrolaimus sp. JU765 TaxID=591449 RepID=A0AC34PY60_9BILA